MSKVLDTILEKVNTIDKIESSILSRIIDVPLECKPDGDKNIKELNVLSNQKKLVSKLESEIKLLISVLETEEDITTANTEFTKTIGRYNETLKERISNINTYYAEMGRVESTAREKDTKNRGGIEQAIGLKVTNIIGAILVLIGVMWISTTAYMMFGNVFRCILTTLIGVGFTVPGYRLYNKNRKNIFGVGILGCGISILYASVLMGCVAYNVYNEIIMLLLMIVLTAIMNSIYLKFKSEWLNAFMVIGCYLPCCSRLIFDESMVVLMGFYLVLVCLATTIIGSRGKYGISLCIGAVLSFIATLIFTNNACGDYEILQLFLIGITSIIYIYMSSVNGLMRENVNNIQRAIVSIGYTLFSVIGFCVITQSLLDFDKEITSTYFGNIVELVIIYAFYAVLYFVSHLIKSASDGIGDENSTISKITYIAMRVIILTAAMLCTNLIKQDDKLTFILISAISLIYLGYAEFSKKVEFSIAGFAGWGVTAFCTLMQASEWLSYTLMKSSKIIYDYEWLSNTESVAEKFNELDIACFIGVILTAFLVKTWKDKDDFRGKVYKFLLLQPVMTVLSVVLILFNMAMPNENATMLIIIYTILTPIMYMAYKAITKPFEKISIADSILDAIASILLLTVNLSLVYRINRFATCDEYETFKVLIQSLAFSSSALYSIIVYTEIYLNKEYVTEFKVLSKMVITLFTICMACSLYDFKFTDMWISFILIGVSAFWLKIGFKKNIKIQRVCSLILLMGSTIKLCVVDVVASDANPLLIIPTCFVCGLSLLGISYMYQRLEKKHANIE